MIDGAATLGRRLAVLRALLLVLAFCAATPAEAADTATARLQPADTSSPRATLRSFLANVGEAYERWRNRSGRAETLVPAQRALHTLDLRHVGEALIFEIGIDSALYLYETLARLDLPDEGAVPTAEELERAGRTQWTVPGTEIVIAKVADGPRAGDYLFTEATVQRAAHFYDLVKELPVRRGPEDVIGAWRSAPGLGMPAALAAGIARLPAWAHAPLVEQPLWKWTAALAAFGLVVTLGWLAWGLGRRWDRACHATGRGWPVGGLGAASAAIALAFLLAAFLNDMVLLRGQPGLWVTVFLTTVTYGLLAWLAGTIISGIGQLVIRLSTTSSKSLDAALIRLCFRILSILAALLVLLHAAAELGLSIAPILAGLGVGGLAVALAIRPTLENVIAGFVLFADKPVRVGEFCAFGDKLGTVEEIGLRSTRIRGLDRTVITVPNADFAQLQIVNYSRRDMNLLNTTLELRTETTPDQLRYIVAKIRKLLIQHPEVMNDPARVRVAGYKPTGIQLELFAFVHAIDWNEFLAVREDLALRIAEIVRDAGSEFAIPAQAVHVSRDPGLDQGRAAEAEEAVQRWRKETRLPFPDYDYAERAEMEDTLAYPPPGSPHRRRRETAPATSLDERPRPNGWSGLLRGFRLREGTPFQS
ncbi:MAG: mechanosensitive ion channel family protein [Geminicoccaceae bacterium]